MKLLQIVEGEFIETPDVFSDAQLTVSEHTKQLAISTTLRFYITSWFHSPVATESRFPTRNANMFLQSCNQQHRNAANRLNPNHRSILNDNHGRMLQSSPLKQTWSQIKGWYIVVNKVSILVVLKNTLAGWITNTCRMSPTWKSTPACAQGINSSSSGR